MEQLSHKNIKNKFLASGIITSIILLIVLWTTEIYFHDYIFSFDSIVKIHRDNPILFLVDVTPAVILIIVFYTAKSYMALNEILESELKEERERSKEIYNFIENLRKGNTDVELEIASQQDKLSKALINLRNELKQAKKEDEIRKKEEQQRHWMNEGLTHFSTILRENIGDLERMSYEVISNLVRYIDAKVAAIFTLEETDDGRKYFDMRAAFAYGRKKYADKKIEWGEGLITACAMERKTIFIKEATENYIKITSGLGSANPRAVLIVPLLDDEHVHGAIEIASFKVYEPHEIEFVEKLAESIASTISTIKINMRTAKLLEESRKQAEILKKQEAEMRKNMKMLEETQREAQRQGAEFMSFTNSVNHTMIRAEYSPDGNLIFANSKFLSLLGYSSTEEVMGNHITSFINPKDVQWFNEIWERLKSGGKHFEGEMKHLTKDGKDVWTMSTYVSVRDENGTPLKILFLGIDITEIKKVSLDHEGQINALNRSTIKAEFTPDKKLIELNQNLLSLLNFQDKEKAIGLSIKDLIIFEDDNELNIIWENILKGIPFDDRISLKTTDGTEIYLSGTFTVVYDMYGEPAKVIFIGSNITEQVFYERKIKQQTEILKEQEKKLKQAKEEISKKLEQAKAEIKSQYVEIEEVKKIYDNTIEGLLDAVIIIDRNNLVTLFNKAAEDLWGINRNEILGRDIKYILPDKYEGQEGIFLGTHFKAFDKTLVGQRKEVYIVDKKGNRKNVLVTLSEAYVGTRYSLTAFIQQIEIELF